MVQDFESGRVGPVKVNDNGSKGEVDLFTGMTENTYRPELPRRTEETRPDENEENKVDTRKDGSLKPCVAGNPSEKSKTTLRGNPWWCMTCLKNSCHCPEKDKYTEKI